MAGKRGRRVQDLIWRLEALGFDVGTAFLRLLPVDFASDAGAVLMRWIGPLTGVQKTVDRNLRIAFPDMTPQERKRISIAQWGNFGRYCFEMPLMDRLTPATGRVEVVGARAEIGIPGHRRQGEPALRNTVAQRMARLAIQVQERGVGAFSDEHHTLVVELHGLVEHRLER